MKNQLVLNETEKARIQSLTVNFLPKLVRHGKMEGKDYLVVPMVMLTEGVHSGSGGPMLYPKEELAKTPQSWNYKPVVVYHPEQNGMALSACTPDIISSRKVGVMMNTKFEKGKLKSEAWLEVSRADEVDPRIMEAIQHNQMMEVSTGVFVDMEADQGEWEGEQYLGIARNYRPDHLALLPDKIGACSIADGAGFLRNQSPEKRSLFLSALDKVFKELGIQNAMSHGKIRDALGEALRLKNKQAAEYPFVESVYDDFVIYSLGEKLFRVSYTADEAQVSVQLGEETPVEVRRVTEYRTMEGDFVGNHNTNTESKAMNEKKVKAILAANIGYVEADRDSLMALTEKQLDAILAFQKEDPTVNFAFAKDDKKKVVATVKTTEPAPAPAPAATVPPAAAPATNTQTPAPEPKKIVTLDDYIANAPATMQEVLRNGLSVYQEEKNKLVESLFTNKNNPFSKEELANKPLNELRNLARLAGTQSASSAPAPNYSGQATVPTGNAAEEAMEVPTLNFAKK